MRAQTEEALDVFVRAHSSFRRSFPLHDGFAHVACALMCVPYGAPCEPRAVRECASLVKKTAGLTNPYRARLVLPTASLLSLSGSAESHLNRALALWGRASAAFGKDDYLAVAALLCAGAPLPSLEEGGDAACLVRRAQGLRDAVKGRGARLVGGNFASLCLLAAWAGALKNEFARGVERGHAVLAERFGDARGLQTCAHVLSLAGGDVGGNACRTTSLYDALLARGCVCGTSYELSSLASLVVVGAESQGSESLEAEVAEATRWLGDRRGFGAFSPVTSVQRVLIACSVVAWGIVRGQAGPASPPIMLGGAGPGGSLALAGSFLTAATTLAKTSGIAVGL